jgi:hypothetical protein
MTFLQTFPATVLWVMVAIRLVGLRFGWKVGVLPALSMVALAVTLNFDAVYLFVDQLLGGWNLLNLIVHLLIGAAITELGRLLLQASGRPDRDTKVLVGVGTVLAVVQVVLLIVSDTEGSADSFTGTFGHMPTIALYQATFFGWFGIIAGYTAVSTLRRDRCGESDLFRLGFNVLGIAGISGAIASIFKMATIGIEVAGRGDGYAETFDLIYQVFLALMIIGFAVGFILPSSGRVMATYAARKENKEALNALRPILHRLAQTPQGKMSMEATDISLDARTSKTQLYRWFIVLGDIRVLDPELLSPRETEIVNEIGKRIEHNGPAAQRATTGP